MKAGYHVSHEQFSPSNLLSLVELAEAAGFNAILSSDHFAPWSRLQGQSGFAWSWLGAALQAAKTDIPFGVVCAPVQRYHPAVIAQAAATLAEMFPGRFWLAVGSGQYLNESITGAGWPPKELRNERLLECAETIRRLWLGETVSSYGYVTTENARLYSFPSSLPLLIGAAITSETAHWLGSWADGMITISRPLYELKNVVAAFRNGGGAGKPIYLKVQLSYAKTYEEALRGAWDQWRTNIFPGSIQAELRSPDEFEAAAQFTSKEDLEEYILISENPKQHLDWLKEYAELGFEHLYLHNVNREQELFIQDFGQYVLPELLKMET